MNDLKELGKLMKEPPVTIVVTLAATAVGAILVSGAMFSFIIWVSRDSAPGRIFYCCLQ